MDFGRKRRPDLPAMRRGLVTRKQVPTPRLTNSGGTCRKTFGGGFCGGAARASREEILEELVSWFRHEIEEQLGLKPAHYNGPDEDA
jgi:hypothetical protein